VLRQTDLKRLIAYSSVSHMGFRAARHLCLERDQPDRSHPPDGEPRTYYRAPVCRSGIVMHNTHERTIGKMGGLAKQMPRVATIFVVAGLGAMGLPSTSGFLAEFTTFLGAFTSTEWGELKSSCSLPCSVCCWQRLTCCGSYSDVLRAGDGELR